MHVLLIAAAAPLAAVVLSASPAEAQSRAGPGFAAGPGAQMQGDATPRAHRDDGDRDGHHRHRHRRLPQTVVIGDLGWNDAWALYNNRTFEHDSYNDWWHERPHRSYPRWVHGNADCDRLWWGGGVWRCAW